MAQSSNSENLFSLKTKHCYLAVLILDLIMVLVALVSLAYGIHHFSRFESQVIWLWLIWIIVFSFFFLHLYYGWKGYFHRNVGLVKKFAFFKFIMALIAFHKIFGDLIQLQIGCELLMFLHSMLVAYVSFMFVEQLSHSQ